MTNRLTPHFHPFEMRLLDVLGDGKPHSKRELRDVVENVEESSLNTILSRIRQRLMTLGPISITYAYQPQDSGMIMYQLVRYIPASLADVNRHVAKSVKG